ncbi:MAG TPA: hypothetical protein VFA09_04505 [Ktedonobacteraceae bacterium]|jgi:hypothetical protein|nr:hypothetical protein [Ktedonobacteraceae bacterium]
MTQQSDRATMFLLAGEGVKISYYVNEDNSSELDYEDANGTLTFQSDHLNIQNSSLGTLITATLKSAADSGARMFTLVLPQVKLGGQTEQPLETLGIITQDNSTKSKAGAQLTYQVIPLKGTGQYTDY